MGPVRRARPLIWAAVKAKGSAAWPVIPHAVNLQADFRIEAGEAQALWLGKRLECPVAVDDGPTIKACKVLGVQFVTAIHFLINLRVRGKLELPLALAKLDGLAVYGRYSRKIIEDATRRLKGGN